MGGLHKTVDKCAPNTKFRIPIQKFTRFSEFTAIGANKALRRPASGANLNFKAIQYTGCSIIYMFAKSEIIPTVYKGIHV